MRLFCNIINLLQYNLPSLSVFPIPPPCPSLFPSVRCLGFPRPLAFLVSKDVIELIGIVEECFPNATFRVRVTSEQAAGHTLHCHLAGRMRVNRVRILPGDRVKLEMTPYDLGKGRIVYRFSPSSPPPPSGTTPPPAVVPPPSAAPLPTPPPVQ
ncbi:MAG: translation initiation factor IF-1 [Candidatus Peribacteraceae bacterium]|nr:translation initiation factor IF-1 [Candidatus Peribacteraceae bacterium]